MKKRAFETALLFLAAWCSCSHAATLLVGNAQGGCPTATYPTIGTALTAAAAGDEIDVCPGLYPEQLVITQPVTLRGIGANGIQRVLVQPATLSNIENQQPAPGFVSTPSNVATFQAVISVLNTSDVVIEGLAIDASNNTVTGCTVTLAGIHFSNASGTVANNAILGAQLSDPLSCTTLFPGNGFGIQVDTTTGQTGPFSVSITGNSIHDFNRDGILVNGSGITAEVSGNTITGVGPSTGYHQFGVFIAKGAVGQVVRNIISQGNCGTIDVNDCINLRSEGVVLRAVGDGTVVDSNVISNVQSGIFINGGNNAQITNNVIKSIDALDGIDIQGTASGFFTNSVIAGNMISHVFPISSTASSNETGCGINEASGTGVAQNFIVNNTINDAFCGVAFVTADKVFGGVYANTLYTTLNTDQYPTSFPPAVEP